MKPPVPIESLPLWVQEKIKLPAGRFCVGDKVYGFLYNEPNGVILDVQDSDDGIGPTQWVRIGFDLNPLTGRYRSYSSGAPYCVKYSDESTP